MRNPMAIRTPRIDTAITNHKTPGSTPSSFSSILRPSTGTLPPNKQKQKFHSDKEEVHSISESEGKVFIYPSIILDNNTCDCVIVVLQLSSLAKIKDQ